MKQEQHHHQGENSQSQTVNNFWGGGRREWGDRWAVQKFVEQKTCELFKIMLVHRQKLHRVEHSKGVPWCIFNYVSAICQQIKVRYLKLTNRLGRSKSKRNRTENRWKRQFAIGIAQARSLLSFCQGFLLQLASVSIKNPFKYYLSAISGSSLLSFRLTFSQMRRQNIIADIAHGI